MRTRKYLMTTLGYAQTKKNDLVRERTYKNKKRTMRTRKYLMRLSAVMRTKKMPWCESAHKKIKNAP